MLVVWNVFYILVSASKISPSLEFPAITVRNGSTFDFKWSLTITPPDTKVITAVLVRNGNDIASFIPPSDILSVAESYKGRISLSQQIKTIGDTLVVIRMKKVIFFDAGKYILKATVNSIVLVGEINLSVQGKVFINSSIFALQIF